MGIVLLFANQQAAAQIHSGAASLALTLGVTTNAEVPRARVDLPITFGRTVSWTHAPTAVQHPELVYEAAFASPPLTASPTWVDLSTRVRNIDTARGRSYEFDRMETGTASARLSNRDSHLSPDNSASPYAPLKSTRPVRARLKWNTTYPLFRGISEGYPQSYPNIGKDAIVEIRANDLFYALNNARFTPGSTTLTTALSAATADGEETITVASTALPMPQAVPFTVTIGGPEVLPPGAPVGGWPDEEMTVTEIVSPTQWVVSRTASGSYEHPAGAVVTTAAVSFGEEMSGMRIQNVLYAIGFTPDQDTGSFPTSLVSSPWWDLELGQSLLTASGDLSTTNPLEHINLVVEAEFGRFFVSREGKLTFRDRHSVYLDHLTPDITFAADQVPYVLTGPLEHSDEKLYNRVRITIQGGDYDGEVVDVADEASRDEHFERVYERTFPYVNPNDAVSAAQYVLSHSAETMVRLPGIAVQGAGDAANLWPLLLAREIGDRARLRYQPDGGGDEIDRQLVIDGISHSIAPKRHIVTFRCTEISSLDYWVLGRTGYSELGSTTRVAF